MLKLGIIGCGRIAEKHIKAYQKLADTVGGLELVVTDHRSEQKTKAEALGVTWVDSPEALFSDGAIAAIDVCTPTPAHTQYILAALEQGKSVFCEKPMTMTADEARAIQAMSQKTGQFVMVGYLFRYHPAFQLVKQLLTDNIIGKPHFANFRIGVTGGHSPWIHNREAGGGAAHEVLVHMMDLARWYFGDMDSVENLVTDKVIPFYNTSEARFAAEAEDLVLLNLRSQDNVRVFCQSDLITGGYMNYVEVHGDNGSVFTSIMDTFPTIVQCREARGDYPAGKTLKHFEFTDLFALELGEFLTGVKNNTAPTTNTSADSLALSELLEAAFPETLMDQLLVD